MASWLSPDGFGHLRRPNRNGIQRLRENFLRVLEHLLLSRYEEGHEWEVPVDPFDHGDYAETPRSATTRLSAHTCTRFGDTDRGFLT
jgi:hypothetical protein